MGWIVPEGMVTAVEVALRGADIRFLKVKNGAFAYALWPEGDAGETIALALPLARGELRAALGRRGAVGLWDWLWLRHEVAAVAAQLDRWKRYYDRLPAEVKGRWEVAYLYRHLLAQIIYTCSAYQRNEAVGLNLAKGEILERRSEKSAKPALALCGDGRILSSLDFLQAAAEVFAPRYRCYGAFSYRLLWRSCPKLVDYLRQIWPWGHRFRHRGQWFWEDNGLCFDYVLVVTGQEAASEEMLSRLRRRQKPLAIVAVPDGDLAQIKAALAEANFEI